MLVRAGFLFLLSLIASLRCLQAKEINCDKLLNEIGDYAYERLRSQNQLDSNSVYYGDLKVGDSVYLKARAFESYPMIRKKIKDGAWMRVVRETNLARTPAKYAKRSWRGHGRVLTLESELTGSISIPAFDLLGQTFSSEKQEKSQSYKSGEIVEIAPRLLGKKQFKYHSALSSGEISWNGFDGLFGIFIEAMPDASSAKVAVATSPMEGSKLSIAMIKVPLQELKRLTTGVPSRFHERLRSLTQMRQTFEVGESVRYRDENGLMRTGQIVDRSPVHETLYGLQSSDGKILVLDSREIFKKSGNDKIVKTPYLNLDPLFSGAPLRFEKPQEYLRVYLDAAARFTSLLDFQKLKPQEKLMRLSKFVHSTMSYTPAGKTAESGLLSSFSWLSLAGVGVCRHQAAILATILNEAGFHARVVHRRVRVGSQEGHAWVEVEVPDSFGVKQLWIVDSTTNKVIPVNRIHKSQELKEDQNVQRWYTHPYRFYEILPQLWSNEAIAQDPLRLLFESIVRQLNSFQ